MNINIQKPAHQVNSIRLFLHYSPHCYFCFRKSLPCCQRISRMLSNESLRPPVYSRSNSQASVDSTSMEDFWCEVENIKENTEERQDEQTLLEIKPPDGMNKQFWCSLIFFFIPKRCWYNKCSFMFENWIGTTAQLFWIIVLPRF